MSQVLINDSIAYLIHRCARLLRRHFLQIVSEQQVELTPEQWFVLNKLIWEDGQSQGQLGESIFSDRPNISRIITGMERRGLVSRREDPEDGRLQRVFLTAEGRATHERLATVVPQVRREVFRGLSQADLDHVARVIQVIEHNVQQL